MDQHTPDDFDFETWERLAKQDPALFERKRAEAIERIINSAPASKQQRLRGLQWQVDQTRARAKPTNSLRQSVGSNVGECGRQ